MTATRIVSVAFKEAEESKGRWSCWLATNITASTGRSEHHDAHSGYAEDCSLSTGAMRS